MSLSFSAYLRGLLQKARPPKGAVPLFGDPAPAPPGAGPAGEVQHPGIRGGQGHVRVITRGPREGQMAFMYGDDPQPETPAAPEREETEETEAPSDAARLDGIKRLLQTETGRVLLARIARRARVHCSDRSDPVLAAAYERLEYVDRSAIYPDVIARMIEPAIDTAAEGLLMAEAHLGVLDYLYGPVNEEQLASVRHVAKTLPLDKLGAFHLSVTQDRTQANAIGTYEHFGPKLNRATQDAALPLIEAAKQERLARARAQWETKRTELRQRLHTLLQAAQDGQSLGSAPVRKDADIGKGNLDPALDSAAVRERGVHQIKMVVRAYVPALYRALFEAHGGTFVSTLRTAQEVVPGNRWLVAAKRIAGWYHPADTECWVRATSENPEHTALHEMGHALDHAAWRLLGTAPDGPASSHYYSDHDPAFQKIYRRHKRNTKLWDYMRKKPFEMFAEGFAMYYDEARPYRAHLDKHAPDLAAYFEKLHADLDNLQKKEG